MLATFRIVRQQNFPDAKLAVIVGMSSEIADPGVVNHGYVSSPEKMRELFLSSDLVLAPARCDPFPTFLIEAMNFGVPCVTSDADGMPEIVAHQLTGLVISEVSAPGSRRRSCPSAERSKNTTGGNVAKGQGEGLRKIQQCPRVWNRGGSDPEPSDPPHRGSEA